MSTWVLLTITGLGLGAMYFLIASGLSLIYGLMGVLNFAHGAFITVGAYASWYAQGKLDGIGSIPLRFLAAALVGLAVGGASGYFGGWVDDILQRICEMVMLLPGFYLLLLLRYMFPMNMDSTKVYFAVILILSLVGWAAFARVIRGMVLSIRKEDYVQAARAMGLSHARIIAKHVIPNTMGYVVVATTLRIPGYILGESALSLLGLGIMEPTPSWGNMLSKAMDILELNQHPWVLWPGVFIFAAIMAFNLVGDGLRDAVDPRGLTK